MFFLPTKSFLYTMYVSLSEVYDLGNLKLNCSTMDFESFKTKTLPSHDPSITLSCVTHIHAQLGGTFDMKQVKGPFSKIFYILFHPFCNTIPDSILIRLTHASIDLRNMSREAVYNQQLTFQKINPHIWLCTLSRRILYQI